MSLLQVDRETAGVEKRWGEIAMPGGATSYPGGTGYPVGSPCAVRLVVDGTRWRSASRVAGPPASRLVVEAADDPDVGQVICAALRVRHDVVGLWAVGPAAVLPVQGDAAQGTARLSCVHGGMEGELPYPLPLPGAGS